MQNIWCCWCMQLCFTLKRLSMRNVFRYSMKILYDFGRWYEVIIRTKYYNYLFFNWCIKEMIIMISSRNILQYQKTINEFTKGIFLLLPFGASNLQSHPFGGSPHLLKNSWPVVPAWPGLWLPETKPSIFNLHLPHLKLMSYINCKSNKSFIKCIWKWFIKGTTFFLHYL